MTIMHHPHDSTLAAFAGRTLDDGQSLVVAVHMRQCPQCRTVVRALRQMAGAWLDEIEPTSMSCDALVETEARLTQLEEVSTQDAMAEASETEFHGHSLAPWRWLGPGVRSRAIILPAEQASRVFLLEAQPGTRLPHHKHSGTEWTCVLEGAFAYDNQRFAAGDFDEADESVEHVPVVEKGEVCLCLVVMQGHLVFQGVLGRLLQRFVQF